MTNTLHGRPVMLASLVVVIGDKEVRFAHVRTDNGDFETLLGLSTAADGTMKLTVQPSAEAAEALGRLQFLPADPKRGVPVVTKEVGMVSNGGRRGRVATAEDVENLSKTLASLEITVRTINALDNAGIRYVHQVAGGREADLMKLKNFGRKSLDEVKQILWEDLGLELAMDLSGVWEQLPHNDPGSAAVALP